MTPEEDRNGAPLDAAYKRLFSNREMVASLLRDFVPESFVKDIDFDTLEICNGSYVADDLKSRHSDCVWKMRWKNGQPVYLYLLLEFQSTPDPWMAVRILAYTALLWQDLIRRGEIPSGGALPPVFPLVLYNGTPAWNAARDIASLLAPVSKDVFAWQPAQRYFLIDVNRVALELLAQSGGLATHLLKLETAGTPGELREVLLDLGAALRHPRYRELRRAFIAFLRQAKAARGVEIPETATFEEASMLAENIKKWEQTWLAEGREEGILTGMAKGREEGILTGMAKGQRKVALNMLRSGLSKELVAQCTGLSLEELERLARE